MENIPLNANRHLRFQKCLPTESSQSASRVANRAGSVNIRLPFVCGSGEWWFLGFGIWCTRNKGKNGF